MAGYIGSKSSVTLVDGYTEAEADAEFVTKTGDTMSGNLDVTGTVTSDGFIKTPYISLGNTGNSYQTVTGSSDGNDLTYRAYQNHIFKNTTGASSSTDGTERMRIDSSGNLLVGTTNTNPAENNVNGVSLYTDGRYFGGTTSNEVMRLNRKSTDGDILVFHKDGSTVGSIGTVSNNLYFSGANFGIRTAGSGLVATNTAGALQDNTYDLGEAGTRWDDVRATNGTIQTSDFNEKQDIASLTATEMLVGKRISALFKTFRWKDAVVEKGDNARTHTGVIAQDVQAAFTAEGLDAGDYALFISDTWWEHDVDVPAVEAVAEVLDEDGNVTTEAVEAVDAYTRTGTYYTEAEAPEGATSKTRLGIRYPELLSFVAAYNEQRFASIEARLTALEA